MPEIIREYIKDPEYRRALGLPEEITESYKLLAQGEYNINYLFAHPVSGRKLLLRVNMGSQMHLDSQIEYEAHALRLLGGSGRTPRVLYSDGSMRCGEHGILVMEYLLGEYPRYSDRAEMDAVMECLSDIHAVPVPEDEVIYGEPESVPRDTVKLIAPADPAIAILDECESMVKTYMDSPLGDDDVKRRLRRLLDRGHELAEDRTGIRGACCASDEKASGREAEHSCDDAYDSGVAFAGSREGKEEIAGANSGCAPKCCINTELNSTNFLVEYIGSGILSGENAGSDAEHAGGEGAGESCFGTKDSEGNSALTAEGSFGTAENDNKKRKLYVRLVDWEKPLYGDPAQDLGHLLAPTTTFWKTDDILSSEETDRLINKYIEAVGDRFDTSGIASRTKRLINITCLRGLTWCAMAWVQYRDPRKAIANESTRIKLDAYLSDSFLSDIEARLL